MLVEVYMKYGVRNIMIWLIKAILGEESRIKKFIIYISILIIGSKFQIIVYYKIYFFVC
jgi:hypothetical protein